MVLEPGNYHRQIGHATKAASFHGYKMNEGLYRVDLDPETAKDLAQTGATVLMLGVPGTVCNERQ